MSIRQSGQTKIEALKTAITNLITNHNDDTTSHSDIRNNIPIASSAKPSADTSAGNKGTSTDYARADHIHPKSSIYAASSHNHTSLGSVTTITTPPSVNFLQASTNTINLFDSYLKYVRGNNTIEYRKNNTYYELATMNDIPDSISDLTNDSNFIKTSGTNGLIKNDGSIDTNTYLTSHQSLDSKTVSIEKQANAETGYTATYVLKQGGTALSPKINIPKDYLVKSASLEIVRATPTGLERSNNLTTGDKYLKFIINTQENDDSTILIIPVSELVDTYTADNTTIELTNNVFSVKSNVFADKVHTHNQYLTEHQSITGKEDSNNKVTSLSSSSTDTQYPSAKVVYDSLSNKADSSDFDTLTATVNYTDNTSETVTFYVVPSNNNG